MSKRSPSREEIEAALTPAFIKVIEALNMEEDKTTLCRTMRALMGVMFTIAEAGGAPPSIVAEQIQRVGRKRFPKLKSGPNVLVMPVAKA